MLESWRRRKTGSPTLDLLSGWPPRQPLPVPELGGHQGIGLPDDLWLLQPRMLHDLFCGDPLLRADLEGLGHIGAAILEVDPLGVPDNLTLALTHCSHFGLACVHARFQSSSKFACGSKPGSSSISIFMAVASDRSFYEKSRWRTSYIIHTSGMQPYIYIDLKKKHFLKKILLPSFFF